MAVASDHTTCDLETSNKSNKAELPILVRETTDGRGRGLFTRVTIPRSTLILEAPVLVLSQKDTEEVERTALGNYTFDWNEGRSALVLSEASMINHSRSPNTRHIKDFERNLMLFVAYRDIAPGEEITINYGTTWFDVIDASALAEPIPQPEEPDNVMEILPTVFESPLVVKSSKRGGRGLFTNVDIPAGETALLCPAVVLSAAETLTAWDTLIGHYFFGWDDDRCAVAFSIGSMMNHSPRANLEHINDFEATAVRLVAKRDIKAGDELCICYREVWFDVAEEVAEASV